MSHYDSEGTTKVQKPGHFVAGKWREPADPDLQPVFCPSTEEPIGYTATATADEVDEAVRASRIALESRVWSRLSMEKRAQVVRSAAELIRVAAPEIGHLVTSEMGQPITIAVELVGRGADTMDFFADMAGRIAMTEIRTDGGMAAVVREPVGVVAAIAPWNGPFNMAITKIVPHLLAGCSVVFKPAPETPFDVAYLVDALTDAGLPSGVLNVVTGGAETGEHLVSHPDIDKVSFTGSTAAGRKIGAIAGGQLKRIQLELGGKSAAIVLDDADLGLLAASVARGTFFNSGQVCAALSRVLVPRSLQDSAVEALVDVAAKWRPGDPFESTTTMGPLAGRRHLERVSGYVARAEADGAVVRTGGRRPDGLERGFFFESTVLTDVDNSMAIAREEVFGPVVVVIPHDGVDDAVAIANDSQYGLHGAVFTASERAALEIASRVRTGTFTLNGFLYNNRAPFGGVKASGVGRDTGLEGLESCFELKTINLPSDADSLRIADVLQGERGE